MTKTMQGTPEEEPEDNLTPHFSITSDGAIYANSTTGTTLSGTNSVDYVTVTTNNDKFLMSFNGQLIHQCDNTAESPELFSTWLNKTKTLQEEYYGKKFEDFDHNELVQWVRINVLAADDELHEALGEISWKPWAKAEFFNREAYLGELVDVLHFVGNLLVGAGVTDAELNAAYLDKMERNRERQRTNYTGLEKCFQCKRAVDDIEAHGGHMVQSNNEHQLCEDCCDQSGSGGPNDSN